MSTRKTLTLQTLNRNEFKDITEKVQEAVNELGIQEGFVVIFIPHTTAGVTINENADPDVRYDMLRFFDESIPWVGNYRHLEGNTAAHIKASLMGSSVTIMVENSRLVLGTWQGIYFAEFDGPRKRKVYIKGMH